jgi:hypothetical protein
VSASPRVKGAGIRPFLAWYGTTWGKDRLQRHYERIPPPMREGLDMRDPHLGILGSTWYPAATVHAVLDGVEAEHTAHERAGIVREGAHAIIKSTLGTVYRFLIETMMTPELYARSCGKLFSRFYEPGLMTKTAVGATGHLTKIENWGAHHPMLCDFILHTAGPVYELLGCKNLRIERTACLKDGSPDCRFETFWS